jgi:hypothetical protein
MDLFTGAGSRVVDVVGISALFLQVMLFEYELKDEKYRRWKYVNLFAFYGYTSLTIMSSTGRGVKLYAAVMLLSVVIVEIIIGRKRRLEAIETIGPNSTELHLQMESAEQVMRKDRQALRKLAK